MEDKVTEKGEKIIIEYEYQDNIDKNEIMGNSLENFSKLQILEEDKNSIVYKGKSTINYKEYAIKVIPQNLFDKYKNEIEFCIKANHPNIVKCFNYFQEEGNTYIIMELMEKDLEKFYDYYFNYGLKIQTNILLKIINQSLYALEYICNKNQSRNIRLKNIFIDENFNIKIGIMSIYSMYVPCSQNQALGILLQKLFNICEINEIMFSYKLKALIDNMANSSFGIKIAKQNFINNFLKDSSIKAVFNCLNNLKDFNAFFSNINDSKFIIKCPNYENKLIFDIIKNLNKVNIFKEEKEKSYIELRKYFAKDELFIKNNNIEILPENLIYFIFEQLNDEFYKNNLPKNIKDELCFFQKTNNKEEILDLEKRFNIFTSQKYSFISKNFMSFSKNENKCLNCDKETRNYSWSYYISIPEIENNNQKINININDIINNVCFLDRTTNKICDFCGKMQFCEEKKLSYIIPKNLIIFLNNKEINKNKVVINFDEALKLKNEYTKKEFIYELKGIISKELKGDDYFYYIKNEKNIWNSSKGNNIYFDKFDENEKAVALFYEHTTELLKNINYKKEPEDNPKANKISSDKNNLNLKRNNSDLSGEINKHNFNHKNNINNNIYISSYPSFDNNNIFNYFNNNETFNNNNNFNPFYNTINNQQDIDLQLKRTQSLPIITQSNYSQLNINNNNYGNVYNNMNNINYNQKRGISNINNKIYLKFSAIQNINANNINNNNININNEIRNRAYSDNIFSFNQNMILSKEDEIPEYFEEKKQNINNIEYIPGKKIIEQFKELS